MPSWPSERRATNETDRINIIHARCRWVVANVRWIASYSQDVPYAELVCADDFSLQRYHVTVAACKVRDALHAGCIGNEF